MQLHRRVRHSTERHSRAQSTCPLIARPACRRAPRPVQPVCYAPSYVTAPEKTEEVALLPLPRNLENPADDVTLANPLQRMERLSTGWFGVIMEYEGVVIENNDETVWQSWLQTADEFGYRRPLGQLCRRIKGVRDEVVVSRVFGWTHNPSVARQVAQRKAEVYEQLMGGRQPAAHLEARPFLETLKRYSIPVALATPLSDKKVADGLQRHNLAPYFDAMVTAEDSGSAEVEFYFAYAAQRIQRPPIRCIVVGESNTTVEAAHELGMKCVVVTGNKPNFDFGGADLVVRNLSQLSFMNMKRLFADEALVESRLSVEEALAQRNSFDDDDYEDDDNDQFGSYPPPW